MKVVLLNTYAASGGAAIACSRLAGALNRHTGVQATMLVQDTPNAPWQQTIARSWWDRQLAFGRFVGERLSFLPYEQSPAVRFRFSPAVTGSNLSHHPLVREADLIHLHWTTFGYQSVGDLGRLMALGKPVVWTMHDMWPFTGGCHHSGTCERYQGQCGNCEPYLRRPGPNDLSHRVWLRKQKAYSGARLVAVGCSRWLAGRANKAGLFRNVPVESIPNPLDTAIFAPAADARTALNLPADKRLILFAAARVGAAGKGFRYFQEALQRLHGQLDRPEDVELLIFGAGDEQLLRELPFKYHFLGRLSGAQAIVRAYSAADLFVIPSLEENLPNTIMESMACGTPVAGFEVGGIPEMIQHRENGYLVQYQSVEDLANGMQWVLSRPQDEYERLADNARQFVLTHYDERLIAGRYQTLYQHLLRSSN